MKVQNNYNQNFRARLVNFKPTISRCAKEGLSEASIKRALKKIHECLSDKNDAVIIAEQCHSIFSQPVGIGVRKSNGVFRYTEIAMADDKNDLYRIVSAVKKLAKATFKSID